LNHICDNLKETNRFYYLRIFARRYLRVQFSGRNEDDGGLLCTNAVNTSVIYMFAMCADTLHYTDRQTDRQTECKPASSQPGKDGPHLAGFQTTSGNKKLSYRRGTARRAMLVNSRYVARGMRVRKVSNSKRDHRGHSMALAMVSFDRPHTISY